MTRKAKLEEERNYELVTRKRRETGVFFKSLLRFLFSQVGLVVVVILMATLGAEIFVLMEKPNEDLDYEAKRERANDVEQSTLYLSGAFWWYIKDVDTYNHTRETFEAAVDVRLREYVQFVINATQEVSYDGDVEGWDYSWEYPNALLFTISLMTLIGYGHISPATMNGQLFCVFYSLITILTFMFMLGSIGKGLAKGLIYSYR